MERITKRVLSFAVVLAMVFTSINLNVMNAQAATKKPTKITLNAKTKTLTVGNTFQLKIKSVSPKNASKEVTYKSSNKKVATVNSKGKVTAQKAGKATITVVSKKNKKAVAKCNVTVKKRSAVSDENIIKEFLRGKTKAKIASDFESSLSYCCTSYDYSSNKSTLTLPNTFTIDQLMKQIKSSKDLYNVKPKASYYIGKTKNNTVVLLLKVEGLNIYCEGDDSFAVFAFSPKNKQLYLNYADDSWVRSSVTVYDDFSFESDGSGGAGAHYSDHVSLDENGKYKFDYQLEHFYAEWIDMKFKTNASFGADDEVYILTTSDGVFYSIPNLRGNESEYAPVQQALKKKGGKLVKDINKKITNSNGKVITNWTYLK